MQDRPLSSEGTQSPAYAQRLESLGRVWWKRLLPTQLPYQLHLRRMRLGRTLDIGCGVGRNLSSLSTGSVGVDHNRDAVESCRRRGLTAYTVDGFLDSDAAAPGLYDSILMAHVLEHLTQRESDEMRDLYVRYLRPHGRLVFICPQERGYASDSTHVRFVDDQELRRTALAWGARPVKSYSFPLPRQYGPHFTYNEFVCIAVNSPRLHVPPE